MVRKPNKEMRPALDRREPMLKTKQAIEKYREKVDCCYSQENEGENKPDREVETHGMSEFCFICVRRNDTRSRDEDSGIREPEAAIGRERCKQSG